MVDYTLKYSHNIIEHLGLKLYQNKPTNVIAELVSNSWDAEAKNAWIDIISTEKGTPLAILATDDGIGMSDEEIVNNWLVIAKKKEVKRNCNKVKRKPMGRKGIGKLAPFGIGKHVDLITYKDNKINWLSLNYQEMISQNHNNLISTYSPHVIANNLQSFEEEKIVNYIDTLENDISTQLRNRLLDLKSAGKGTIILCYNLNIKKIIDAKNLIKSLGKRFTVSLNTPEFHLHINSQRITQEHCLPEFLFRIPKKEIDYITEYIDIPKFDAEGRAIIDEQTQQPITEKKEVKYWIGFVSSAEQTQDCSGVGVFAHGKVAQDRPFTFNSKGLEIKTRYMYGVIEADWIDEYDDDIISTDRTSIDWSYLGLPNFFDWGTALVRSTIGEYDTFKRSLVEEEIDKKIDVGLPKQTVITKGEKKHLRNLLLEVLPECTLEEDQEARLIEATAKAWTHEPARKLIKSLWEKTATFETNNFPELINQLVDELVPESLSLAVVFSQRVFALNQLHRRINLGKETQLQKLLEEFPWIINKKYEHYFFNKTLKNICKEAEEMGQTPQKHLLTNLPEDITRPDFVFLSTTSENEFLVVEIKGPELTVNAPEIQQLISYVMYIRRNNPKAKIQGLLIAGNYAEGCLIDLPRSLEALTWDEIFLESRLNHMHLLSALLAGSDATADDRRVQQICELGGDSVLDFLSQMSEKNDDLKDIMVRLKKSNV